MKMPQFYVVDDLRQGELNIAHFERLRDAVRAYADLPAANWKALGVQDDSDAVDLIRRVPTRPCDPDGEDVMVLEILEHPMWKSKPSLLVTAQDLADRFAVRYCLCRGCLLPIPTRGALPKRLRDKRLWPSVPGKYETAVHWIEVAGVGTLSLAEFKRRYPADHPAPYFPLILRLSTHGQNKNGSYCALKVTPWEFHLLIQRTKECVDQNKNHWRNPK